MDNKFTIKKERIPEIRITKTINAKIFQLRTPRRLCIAAAEPVLVFDIRNKPRKEKHIAAIETMPSMKRNCSLVDFTNWFPIIAICPLLNAGRKRVNGDTREEASKTPDFFIAISFPGFCLIIFVLCLMLRIKPEAPNNPERRGSKGSFRSILKTINPRIPVNKKTRIAKNFLFSRKIIFNEIAIKPRAIIFPGKFLINRETKYKGKIIRMKSPIPQRQPVAAR